MCVNIKQKTVLLAMAMYTKIPVFINHVLLLPVDKRAFWVTLSLIVLETAAIKDSNFNQISVSLRNLLVTWQRMLNFGSFVDNRDEYVAVASAWRWKFRILSLCKWRLYIMKPQHTMLSFCIHDNSLVWIRYPSLRLMTLISRLWWTICEILSDIYWLPSRTR